MFGGLRKSSDSATERKLGNFDTVENGVRIKNPFTILTGGTPAANHNNGVESTAKTIKFLERVYGQSLEVK